MAACLDLICYALFALLFVGSRSLAETPKPLLGRWDLTIHGAHGDAPSWIEVSRQGGTLKVLAVGPVGDPAEATQVAITGNSLAFLVLKDPSEGKNTDVQYSAPSLAKGWKVGCTVQMEPLPSGREFAHPNCTPRATSPGPLPSLSSMAKI